jgi:ribosomal protein S12 methylthiotransferase accessory factor
MREAGHPVDRRNGAVALAGHGLLADAVGRKLARGGAPHRLDHAEPFAVPAGCRMVVTADDGWDTRARPAERDPIRDARVPWLPVRAELGRVVVGPVELPGVPGCVTCAETRRRLARKHPQGFDAVWHAHGAALRDQPSPLLTALAADLVAALVADEVDRVAGAPGASGTARTRCTLLYVDLRSLLVKAHRFLPDPRCPHCGGLPPDGPGPARITLRPRPKPAPGVYRVRPVEEEMDALLRTYVDDESGLLGTVSTGSEGGIAVASVPVNLRQGQAESGFGLTRSYRASRLTAVLEGLERYGGTEPGGRRTVVRAGFREIADRAVDPRGLGLHCAQSYQRADFPFEPFDEDAQYRWVWAYSFARQEPILVPERAAYYWLPPAPDEPAPFAFDSSNGCAVGGCLEEAILHGILEVAERDAFLMTWYARMAVPLIDPRSAGSRAVPTMMRALEAQTGFQVRLFDTTLEQGIPCCWAMAVDPAERPAGPKAISAAGCHLDPAAAVEKALSELGPVLTRLMRDFPGERDRVRPMVDDPSLVKAMADHSLLYGLPETFDRFDFLTEGPVGPPPGRFGGDGSRTAGSRGTGLRAPGIRTTGFRNHDLSDDLREVVARYLDCGMDVLVVDQTTPEHRAGGLSCVKVVIPGALPMTFGYDARRLEGLPRLHDVPGLLGRRQGRLDPRDVNPHPHPFP